MNLNLKKRGGIKMKFHKKYLAILYQANGAVGLEPYPQLM